VELAVSPVAMRQQWRPFPALTVSLPNNNTRYHPCWATSSFEITANSQHVGTMRITGNRETQFETYVDVDVRIICSTTAECEPDSSVSIVSGYWPDDRGSIPGRCKIIFPLTSVPRPALGPTQPPMQWIPGVLSPGSRARSGRNADHSPPSSTDIENK
jgi:hypothetical protein